MSHHLDEHETALAASGIPLKPERLNHLDGCVSCRRTVNLFLDLIESRRLEMKEEEPDWTVHRDEVLSRLPHTSTTTITTRRQWLGPLLAAAATVTLAVGTGLFVHHNGPAPMPTPRPEIAVEEILAQTESLLAEDGIPDFAVLEDITDDDLTTLFDSLDS